MSMKFASIAPSSLQHYPPLFEGCAPTAYQGSHTCGFHPVSRPPSIDSEMGSLIAANIEVGEGCCHGLNQGHIGVYQADIVKARKTMDMTDIFSSGPMKSTSFDGHCVREGFLLKSKQIPHKFRCLSLKIVQIHSLLAKQGRHHFVGDWQPIKMHVTYPRCLQPMRAFL